MGNSPKCSALTPIPPSLAVRVCARVQVEKHKKAESTIRFNFSSVHQKPQCMCELQHRTCRTLVLPPLIGYKKSGGGGEKSC